jgi:preprotein translocase subunit YajC
MQATLPLLLILMGGFLVFSFRKQKRQAAKAQEMQDSIMPGARIMTTTGLFGTVVAVDDETLQLEIAPGVTTEWLRRAVARVVTEDVDAPELESIPADGTDAIDFDETEFDEPAFDKTDLYKTDLNKTEKKDD